MLNTEDGGVVSYDAGNDAPKHINSDKIIGFDCTLSYIDAVFDEENELEGRVYKLCAILKDELVKVDFSFRKRIEGGEKHEFFTDVSFMKKLHAVVSKYDIAKYNGYCHRVSGLPDMYGECIDIRYASGESIYAFDNQDGFLPTEVGAEMIKIFAGGNKRVYK